MYRVEVNKRFLPGLKSEASSHRYSEKLFDKGVVLFFKNHLRIFLVGILVDIAKMNIDSLDNSGFVLVSYDHDSPEETQLTFFKTLKEAFEKLSEYLKLQKDKDYESEDEEEDEGEGDEEGDECEHVKILKKKTKPNGLELNELYDGYPYSYEIKPIIF